MAFTEGGYERVIVQQPTGWGRYTPAKEVTPTERQHIRPQGGPLARRLNQIQGPGSQEPLVRQLAERGQLHPRDFTENK